MNWKEWLALAILTPPLLMIAMLVLGILVDGIGQSQDEHRACLKRASNGYEIERCH